MQAHLRKICRDGLCVRPWGTSIRQPLLREMRVSAGDSQRDPQSRTRPCWAGKPRRALWGSSVEVQSPGGQGRLWRTGLEATPRGTRFTCERWGRRDGVAGEDAEQVWGQETPRVDPGQSLPLWVFLTAAVALPAIQVRPWCTQYAAQPSTRSPSPARRPRVSRFTANSTSVLCAGL